jgi:hypothetical protein
VELLFFLALDEGSIQGFHERFEFMSLVFWAYRTSIQSNWEFIINSTVNGNCMPFSFVVVTPFNLEKKKSKNNIFFEG